MTRSGHYLLLQQSELAVFTRAKELSKAVFVLTQDAPYEIFPQLAIKRKGFGFKKRINGKLHQK